MNYFEGMKHLPGLPVGRAAYSDRMAYIGAELSRLVYEPFTPDANLTGILQKLGRASNDTERRELLAAWSARLQSSNCQLEDGIRRILRQNHFEPIAFYDVSETQAFLARMDEGPGRKVLMLCFRGTEITPRDIATDLKFPLTPADGRGRIHTGFKQAFERIREQLQRDLAKHIDCPLYTFGHSLGGALALISTRELNPSGNGATYVYGTPRTGDWHYFSRVKTPIYRLEIGGDPVPMIPFGYGLNGFLALIRLIPLNGTLQIAHWLQHRLLGYCHTGFRIFIKHAPNELDANNIGYRKMRVDQSVNIFWRLRCITRAWLRTLPSLRGIAGFHSIALYSDMLKAHMLRRNLDQLKAADEAGKVVLQDSEQGDAVPEVETGSAEH
ncbi:lipase family protein [Microbulbifer halophilus]|uniref:Lipase family protein n=1 Tax=Microbulbifer halophilus TaxID=453963 RepID=A0ABW5EAB2_9GAMM|nr:lipase family protein [Microbulbifer halophilus]MCW8125112.1 lipase family protein [Microbulbifer halophilus]